MITAAATVIFFILTVAHSCQAEVQVQDGDFVFPLKSVKKLRELAGVDVSSAGPQARSQLAFFKVCEDPELPKDFLPVCKRKDAPLILSRLSFAVQDEDRCELCANAACTGC